MARLTCCATEEPLLTVVTATLATIPRAVAELLASPSATIKLLAVAPVVSVSTMPLRAELIDGRDAGRLSVDRLDDFASVSAADRSTFDVHAVAVGDVDDRRACRAPARRGGC